MILYQLKGCPYALRTRIALSAKDLAYETVFIDRANKPREVLQVSPTGTTPVLYDGEVKLRESSVINEYLEDRFPERPLMPRAPEGRAAVRLAIDDLDDLFDAIGALFRIEDGERPGAEQAVREELAKWDARIASGPFVLGDTFTLADVYLYCHLVTLGKLMKEPLRDSKNVRAWFERIAARADVQKAQAAAM